MPRTEAEYRAAHVRRINLRLAEPVAEALDVVTVRTGELPTAAISRMILADSEKSSGRAKKKPKTT